MKRICSNILLTIVACLAWNMHLAGADIEWNPNTTYTIPDDVNAWYTDSTVTLTDTLTVKGTLKVRAGGTINNDGTAIKLNSNATLRVEAEGTINNNGTDSDFKNKNCGPLAHNFYLHVRVFIWLIALPMGAVWGVI